MDFIEPKLDTVPVDSTPQVSHFNEFSSGAGATQFKANKEGIFAGATNFTDAPFSVDYNGHMIAASADLVGFVLPFVFKQDAVPTSTKIGDLWYDTDDGNKAYRAAIVGADAIISGEWELVTDTNKLNATGGAYNTATSGPRVRIFPDANTGIQITDGTNDVFVALVGGTDVGDVIIGNYAGGQGIKYDKSAATTTFQGSILSSIMTGGTIQTAASGYRVKLNGTTNKLEFLSDATLKASLYADASSNLNVNGGDDINFIAGATTVCGIHSNSFEPVPNGSISLGVTAHRWGNFFCGSITSGAISSSGNISNSGDIQCGGTFKSSDGTSGVDSTSKEFVTTMRYDSGAIEFKTRSYTFKDGLMTAVGGESGWNRT